MTESKTTTQPDPLERIAADADSAARALMKQADPSVAVLVSAVCADVLPLLRALAAEVASRDEDLDGRVGDLEEAFEGAAAAILGAQRVKLVAVLQRAVVMGEEIAGLIVAPDAAVKERGRLLAALATEALEEIESASEESEEEEEENTASEVPDGTA